MATDYFRLNPSIQTKAAEGLGWRMQLLLFVIAALLVISRRPDVVTHPQFFAEDGAVWFAEAYRLTFLHSLLTPDAGYVQTFPRLVAALATAVPLLFAPALMNVIGIVVQVLPVNVLAAERSAIWGSLPLRLLMGLTYIALPNSRELDVVITNAQWHLALLACLLILAAAPKTWKECVFDCTVLLVSGLTGPFCIFLVPVAAVIWWVRRDKWRAVPFILTAICAVIQIAVVYQADPVIRSRAPLGASLRVLVEILSSHVFLAALLGYANYPAHLSLRALTVVAIAGLAIIVYATLRAKWEYKLMIVFCMLVFAASMASPLVSKTEPQWLVLQQAYGIRYWFFPMLAFSWSLLWCVQHGGSKIMRGSASFLLILMVAGAAKDWEYPAFPDRNFAQSARKFEGLRPGEAMTFPLYPDGWSMQLVKDVRNCSTLPNGSIDAPPNAAHVSGTFELSGWVNADEPVKELSVYLDGTKVKTLIPTIQRPDVDRHYPGSPLKNKGWTGALNVSGAKPGAHVIELRARLSNGCEAIVGAGSVEVAAH